MHIVVREYANEYFEDVRHLLMQVYDADITADVLEKHYLGQRKTIFIAEDTCSGKLVGTAFIELQEDYIRPTRIAYITYVAVEETYRRHGVGRRLLEMVERYAVKNGCDAMELTSANHRKNAHFFYKNIGFAVKETTVFIKEMG